MLCYLLPECNPSFFLFFFFNFFFLNHAKFLQLDFSFSLVLFLPLPLEYMLVCLFFFQCLFSLKTNFFSVVFNCFSLDLLFQDHARQSAYL